MESEKPLNKENAEISLSVGITTFISLSENHVSLNLELQQNSIQIMHLMYALGSEVETIFNSFSLVLDATIL